MKIGNAQQKRFAANYTNFKETLRRLFVISIKPSQGYV